MEPITVLVVDDHPLFRQGVIDTLSRAPDIAVVGEADSPRQAIERTKDLLPHIVLLDLKLVGGSGLDALAALKRDCPFSKVLILTVYEDEDMLLRALKEGARAYVLKGIAGDELIRVIRAVHAGESYVTPSMAGRVLVELTSTEGSHSVTRLLGELTERERAILELASQGLTNKEIGAKLYLSEKTIKHYMTNILEKLQVRNRVEAALLLAKTTRIP